MTKREEARLDQLLRKWLGEVGVQTVREQVPPAIAKHVDYQISQYIENGSLHMHDERLEPLRKEVDRVSNEAVAALLSDPGFVRESVDAVISGAVSSALLSYADESGWYRRCPDCGNRHGICRKKTDA